MYCGVWKDKLLLKRSYNENDKNEMVDAGDTELLVGNLYLVHTLIYEKVIDDWVKMCVECWWAELFAPCDELLYKGASKWSGEGATEHV